MNEVIHSGCYDGSVICNDKVTTVSSAELWIWRWFVLDKKDTTVTLCYQQTDEGMEGVGVT